MTPLSISFISRMSKIERAEVQGMGVVADVGTGDEEMHVSRSGLVKTVSIGCLLLPWEKNNLVLIEA